MSYKKGRVNFTYETDTEGAGKSVELPFRMLVLSDFSKGHSGEAKKAFDERKTYKIEPGNMDKVMREMDIELKLEVDNHLHEGGETVTVNLPIRCMHDMKPQNIAKNVPDLKQLLQLREQIETIRDKASTSPKNYGKVLKNLGVDESR